MSFHELNGAALIYCEGQFGKPNGTIANELVRSSNGMEILGVIDSTQKGQDSGELLDGKTNGIEIFESLSQSLRFCHSQPTHLVMGVISGNFLSEPERAIVISAISTGLHIIFGKATLLFNDKDIQSLSVTFDVELIYRKNVGSVITGSNE